MDIKHENTKTKIHIDESSIGLGTVLSQKKDGRERVVIYVSHSLLKAEASYSMTEKGCPAIFWVMSNSGRTCMAGLSKL